MTTKLPLDIPELNVFRGELRKKYTLLTEFLTGSRGYGLHSEESDYDVIIVVDTPDKVRYGMSTWVNDHKDLGVVDVKVYTSVELCKMIAKQTLNGVELMWLPRYDYYPEIPFPWVEAHRKSLVSCRIMHSILGHAVSTQKHIMAEVSTTNRGEKRKKLIEEIGYDASRTAHSLRGLFVAKNLLNSEGFSLNITEEERNLVLKIKRQEVAKPEALEIMTNHIEQTRVLESALPEVLQENIDYEWLNTRLVETTLTLQGMII